MRCWQCGAKASSDERYCPECYADLAEAGGDRHGGERVTCSECGTKCTDDDVTCPACGCPLEDGGVPADEEEV